MSGQMKKYDAYLNSLSEMQEPVVPRAKLDIRGAVAYASKRGVTVAELSDEERSMFITYIQ